MAHKTCLNSECKKTYFVEDNFDSSMGCCSYECWEKLFCKEISAVSFPKIDVKYESLYDLKI